MAMRGVVFTPSESEEVRRAHAHDPKGFRARAQVSVPTLARALARLPVTAATRAAILRAVDSSPSNESQPSAA